MAFVSDLESSANFESEVEFEVEPINKNKVDMVKIDSLADGGVKVEFFNFENGRFSTMKVWQLGKVEHARDIVKCTNPVVLNYDCRVGPISQLGGIWLSRRNKVCLRNLGENEKINFKHLSHVTHIRIENTAPLSQKDILPHLRNVLEMTVTGPTHGCNKRSRALISS